MKMIENVLMAFWYIINPKHFFCLIFIFGLFSQAQAVDEINIGDQIGDVTSKSDSAANANAVGLAESGIAHSTSVSTGGQGGQGGAALASGGNSTIVQNYEASVIPPSAPLGMSVPVNAPALFRPPSGTLPATAASIATSIAYIQDCGVSLSDKKIKDLRKKGRSKGTEISFLPHSNYTNMDRSVKVNNVKVSFPVTPVTGRCLGIMSVQSRTKRSDQAFFFTLMNDAMGYAKDRMRGVDEVELLCSRRSIAMNVGINSRGFGGGLSPSSSDLSNSNVFSGLVASITGNKANTFAETQLGLTCVVASTDGDTNIDLSALNQGGIFDRVAITAANGVVKGYEHLHANVANQQAVKTQVLAPQQQSTQQPLPTADSDQRQGRQLELELQHKLRQEELQQSRLGKELEESDVQVEEAVLAAPELGSNF